MVSQAEHTAFEGFKAHFGLTLDQQQEAAIRRTEGQVLLLAVPGSGKTTTLISRLGWMIHQDIPPENILTVTYTVAAARDMARRFARHFGEELAGRLTFRTINGLCAVIIHRYARRKGTEPFELVTGESRLNALVRELLTGQSIPFPTDLQVKEARTHITYCKNRMLTQGELSEHQVDGMDFPALYAAYQERLTRDRLMDYDDQMVFAHRILRQYPELLAQFRRRYPYLCVDEAQDTSRIQHAILRLLAGEDGNLFMVGDEDQSIYGFRAAWPQALLEFDQAYPRAAILKMETNYRSTPAIVDRAGAFIQLNRDRRLKHMTTPNPPGPPIQKVVLEDYADQSHWLLDIAKSCDRPTAVLYRNNDSALPLIDLLERAGLPYSCRQRDSLFFSSPLVRDLTDVLGFAFDDGNGERFLRFYYKLDLKLKKPVVSHLLWDKRAGETVFSALLRGRGLEPWQVGKIKAMEKHFSSLSRLTSFAALNRIVKYMGYGDYIKEQRSDTGRLDVLLSLARQTPRVEAFLSRLEELRALTETPSPAPNALFTLSTIHSAKGLEYDRVVLIDVADGLFPSSIAEEKEADRTALEEERRLFYVGVTRAKQELILLTCREKFGEPAPGSTFLRQLLGEPDKPPAPSIQAAPPHPAGPTAAQLAAWEKAYLPGTRIMHKAFGPGLLESRTGSIAVIAFEGGATKKLDLPTCLRWGLLRLAP